MSETLFALVPIYGGWVIFVATYLSCLALPIPASLIMLGGGAFAASGDLLLWTSALSAYGGAVAGDHTGYLIGKRGGAGFVDRLKTRKDLGDTVSKAADILARRGVVAVFLTRWLLSPLGPYVNFIAGAAGLKLRVFSTGSLSGEAVWVVLYVGLGYGFAAHINEIATVAGNIAGLLAGAALTGVFGWALFRKRPAQVQNH